MCVSARVAIMCVSARIVCVSARIVCVHARTVLSVYALDLGRHSLPIVTKAERETTWGQR